MIQSKQLWGDFFVLVFFFIVFVCFTQHHFFFYDTVQLGAMHGSFYFNANFTKLIPPLAFDSGHLPTFGLYLALVWKVFGKSLPVAHWAMLPFMIGSCWQTLLLVRRFLPHRLVLLAATVLLFDATYLAQCSLVSPDVVLVFFFLLGLNSIFSSNKFTLTLAAFGLFTISMRGIMGCFGLFLFQNYFIYFYNKEAFKLFNFIKNGMCYVPGFTLFVGYNCVHYLATDWVFYHQNSQWAECFQKVGWSKMLYNFGISVWRCFDFGRILYYLIGIPSCIYFIIKHKRIDRLFSLLLILCFIIYVTVCGTTLSYHNLSNHRYYLPVYFCVALFFLVIISHVFTIKRAQYVYFFIGVMLLVGNLWNYPKGVAMGWDCTLSHLSYDGMRCEVDQYLDDNAIDAASVCSLFPLLSSKQLVALSKYDTASWLDYGDTTTRYIVYSNLCNAFDTNDFAKLDSSYTVVKSWKKGLVKMVLYQMK